VKYIINTVNLNIGGAHQRALSFLEELRTLSCSSDRYHIFITNKIDDQIKINGYPENIIFHHFDNSPAAIKYHK
jgi:hypothetical protein